MNEMPAKLKARAARKNAKRDEKKRQIATSAIEALKELGYANTSLRDIAEKSDLSLGMLHYYFEDRTDLIIYCVQLYKQEFVRNITDALKKAQGRERVIDAFSEALVTSIVDDNMTHRLWYDIRTQAMFDATFRPVVAEIEGMLIEIVATAFKKAGHDAPENVEISYALLDGAFRFLMQNQIGKDQGSREELTATFRALLTRFL
ncbi:TetR/AcrR family transcriptional regulator [Ruegeria pomeroyi]|uniref:TetR/AcrR family transcriptional regulator n=1 Tax=Ruegeria alba TaxID=2916756 RepID=A0ABS9P051_9RHOB|nr:TetR/AcrR family transcriptional regulator [Ruegeria alba]MCE8516236.1 TetR/AcrR family transcriptional regulator [Ruegeria pomeroyi]MCE8522655.1 TetR/AcrR family transcriptional regulator [Ruegeria pomeroyi]MCE8533235.1 TetR/AcrR family transcriptional regulator [Ruegeria pomeroyi]MCE8547071.1 TetR/AcrR family transcriptional regulator [Ruegeria pomeroyi]MCE8553852.1 TetR/AcrR family transcriptional regulator [Ruegeria pomeroyi]